MLKRIISMSLKELDRHVVIQKTLKRELTGVQAARLLKVSYRQFKRLKKKVKERGAQGLVHGNRGRVSNKRVSEKERKKIKKIIRKRYPDFKPGFVTEKLYEVHKIQRDAKTVRMLMIEDGIWKPRRQRKKGKHREWRTRKDCRGEMLQFDGSYEYWLEDRADRFCLLASIDDATSEVFARFADDEGVMDVFAFWKEYIREHGKPRMVYTNKFSTYKMTQKVAQENHETLTQFQRAVTQLDIESKVAHSPEAKGRVERLFNTLQDRLIKELRLAKITTKEDANRFLREVFLPKHNQRFSVKATNGTDLHRKLNKQESMNLDSIFSRQKTRVVRNDFTLSFDTRWYQLIKNQPVTVCKKDQVVVEEHTNGEIKLRLRNRYLNYKCLPERPCKGAHQPWVLAKTKAPKSKAHKPAKDHPWRKSQNLFFTSSNLKRGHFYFPLTKQASKCPAHVIMS